MTRRFRAKTGGYFLLCCLSGFSADGAEVRLRPLSEVNRTIVRLGDVADVRAEDTAEQEALQQLELFPAPSQGSGRTVGQQEIRELLNLHGYDLRDWQFGGVRLGRVASARPAPAAEPPQPATAEADGVPVVVALRPLPRGATIRAADVQQRTITAPPRGVSPIAEPGDVVGLQVTRAVGEGELLDSRFLQRALLVQRGDLVTVLARAGGVCVRTTARALEAGARDELVTLESMENRQRYVARVIGTQQAEVFARGTQAAAGGQLVPPPTEE